MSNEGAERSAPFFSSIPSPLGQIVLRCDGKGGALTGLWFAGQRYDGSAHAVLTDCEEIPIFQQTRLWLKAYFAGEAPDPSGIPLCPEGSVFRQAVWTILRRIPCGKTVTYGAIAGELAAQRGSAVSAQAVGGAVGHNPIAIFIPCHRVIGADGALTGYAGGVERKQSLLTLEAGTCAAVEKQAKHGIVIT